MWQVNIDFFLNSQQSRTKCKRHTFTLLLQSKQSNSTVKPNIYTLGFVTINFLHKRAAPAYQKFFLTDKAIIMDYSCYLAISRQTGIFNVIRKCTKHLSFVFVKHVFIYSHCCHFFPCISSVMHVIAATLLPLAQIGLIVLVRHYCLVC